MDHIQISSSQEDSENDFMRQNSNKKNRKPLIISVVVILILATLFFTKFGQLKQEQHIQTQKKSEIVLCNKNWIESKPLIESDKSYKFTTRYSNLSLLLPDQQFDYKNINDELIFWIRKNIKTGDQVSLSIDDKMIFNILAQQVGSKGTIFIFTEQINSTMFLKNLKLNQLDTSFLNLQHQFNKMNQKYIIGGDLTQIKEKFIKGHLYGRTIILKLNNSNDNKQFLNFFKNKQSKVSYIKPSEICQNPQLVSYKQSIKEGFYLIQTPLFFNDLTMNFKRKDIPICQLKDSTSSIKQDNYVLKQSLYSNISIFVENQSQVLSSENSYSLIQWAKIHLKKDEKILYQGQNNLIIVMLSKIIDNDGKIYIPKKSIKNQKLLKKNLQFNKAQKNIQFLQNDFKLKQVDLIITSNLTTVYNKMINGLTSNTNFILYFKQKQKIPQKIKGFTIKQIKILNKKTCQYIVENYPQNQQLEGLILLEGKYYIEYLFSLQKSKSYYKNTPLVCQEKKQFQNVTINQRASLYESKYLKVFMIIQKRNQKLINEIHQQSLLGQWMKKNQAKVKNSQIFYDISSTFDLVLIGKIVGESGRIFTTKSLHLNMDNIQNNLEFNHVRSVVRFNEDKGIEFDKLNYYISQSWQNVQQKIAENQNEDLTYLIKSKNDQNSIQNIKTIVQKLSKKFCVKKIKFQKGFACLEVTSETLKQDSNFNAQLYEIKKLKNDQKCQN